MNAKKLFILQHMVQLNPTQLRGFIRKKHQIVKSYQLFHLQGAIINQTRTRDFIQVVQQSYHVTQLIARSNWYPHMKQKTGLRELLCD